MGVDGKHDASGVPLLENKAQARCGESPGRDL